MSDAAAVDGEWGSSPTIVASVPFAVRTSIGISLLGIAINVAGAAIVGVLLFVVNASATHHQVVVLLKAGVVLVIASVSVGLVSAILLQKRTMQWLLHAETPTPDDTLRVVRFPLQMAVLTIIIWTSDAIALALVGVSADVPGATCADVAGGIVLAGLTTAGITFLLFTRVSQPIMEIALRENPPPERATLSVRSRLLMYWMLTSAAPLLGIMLVLTQPDVTRLRVGTTFAVLTSLVVGLFANILNSRAIGTPLRTMVDAVRAVGHGDLTVAVTVTDPGEIGMLQQGINEAAAGLRERDRVQDLFGRHVGPAVAAEALRSGVTLTGETKHVVALFVDITSSTALTRRLEPRVFVEMLNRFFDIVVTEVESHGGLVNKFEGDAALCIFGAPVELIDASTAALNAARRIRDRVRAADELAIGIGVAAGAVVAGQIGAHSRLEYTVIGDAVNEAARLTDLAKGSTGSLVASDQVVRLASPVEREYWHFAGEVTLRGREVATRIWTA